MRTVEQIEIELKEEKALSYDYLCQVEIWNQKLKDSTIRINKLNEEKEAISKIKAESTKKDATPSK